MNVENPIPTRSTVPWPTKSSPNVGGGGRPVSTPPPAPPEICQDVNGFNASELSSSCALADRPEISTDAPGRFGTSIFTGLVAPNPPKFQVESATVKKLVVSGVTVHAGVTVSVVEPETPATVAAIVVVPGARVVASPFEPTTLLIVAKLVAEEFQTAVVVRFLVELFE